MGAAWAKVLWQEREPGECEGTGGGQGDWSRENDEEGDLRVPGRWVGA